MLKERTAALETSLSELEKTQKYLIESEKLASLGTLVNGISHEINTPLGTCITTTSFLEKVVKDLIYKVEENKLSKSELTSQLYNFLEGQKLVSNSIQKSVEMVTNFKQIASDQFTDKLVDFAVYVYIYTTLHWS